MVIGRADFCAVLAKPIPTNCQPNRKESFWGGGEEEKKGIGSHTKIAHFDFPVGVNKKILRFQVAVDDRSGMQISYSARNLVRDVGFESPRHRERFVFQLLPQIASANKLHTEMSNLITLGSGANIPLLQCGIL